MSNRIRSLSEHTSSNLGEVSVHQLHKNDFSFAPQPPQQQMRTISNFRLKFLMRKLVKRIKHLRPPLVTPEQVTQEWSKCPQQTENQIKQKQDSFGKQSLSQQLASRFFAMKLLQMLEGLLVVIFCWSTSVSVVFRISMSVQTSFMLAVLLIIKFIIKVQIAWKERQKQNNYQITWFVDFIQPSLFLIAVIITITKSYVDISALQVPIGIFQMIVITIQWNKVGRYFELVTYIAQQKQKVKQLRIIQLFIFILVIAHVFGLIMYSMVYVCPPGRQTWLQKAGIDSEQQPWYALYITAVYWANTTIVTVGYGDFSPNNYIQKLILIFLQLLGTAAFGYMINVIGLTVTQIQNKDVKFQTKQSTINKLKDLYQLSHKLCYQMKKDIKKKESQMKEIQLQGNQQNQFLNYIDPALKQGFVLQTNLKVIKKSIFFLTHFTIFAQNQLALKLIRCIYRPQQPILINQNGDKNLAIINSGKVNLSVFRMHKDQQYSKQVRTIKPQQGKPTLNVFGYSALILNKDIPIKALTEQVSAVYLLALQAIKETLSKSPLDFQSFHQLRQKMMSENTSATIQVQQLKDQSLHYMPNILLIIKKIKHPKQSRSRHSRRPQRSSLFIATIKNYSNKTLLFIPETQQMKENEDDIEELYQKELAQIERKEKEKNKNKNKTSDEKDSSYHDQYKQYQRFLKKYNVSAISNEYVNACQRMKQSISKRMRADMMKRNTMMMKKSTLKKRQ